MTIPAIWKSGLRVTSVLVLVLLFLATLALIAMATGGADFQSPQATAEVSNSSLNWGAKQVGADLMWDSDYTGQGVKIGIVDSGIDYTHPAFTNTLISTMDINLGLRDGQGITLDVNDPTGPVIPINAEDPMDYTGHGTNMAGIIAASDPQRDAWGIAYEAEILSVKTTYLVETNPVTITNAAPPGNSVWHFQIVKPSASADDALDVILTWEGGPDLELAVQPPNTTTIYPADQGGSVYDFMAATNIPLQARFGEWKATITNPSGSPQAFTLTTRHWRWFFRPSTMRAGIYYAIDHDVDVINISMSTGPYFDTAIEDAVVKEEIVVVTSAGNVSPALNVSSTLTSWNRHEITVGATNITDTLLDSSAHGPAPTPGPVGVANTKPDVVAPGFETCTPGSLHSFGLPVSYEECNVVGTSSAAAHVSGGAALLIQYLTELTGHRPSPALVKTMLMGTAVDVGIGGPPARPGELKLAKDNYSGAGRIDLYRALLAFSFSGTSSQEMYDCDRVESWTPANLPDVPATPLKGTLYWDVAPFQGFFVRGGDVTPTYTADTAMGIYLTPTVGINVLTPCQWVADAGYTWRFVTTHPPVPQTIDGQPVPGYWHVNTVVTRNRTANYTITVPQPRGTDALRILAYWPDSQEQIDLFLLNELTNEYHYSVLDGVAAKQVATLYEPDGGNWLCWVQGSNNNTRPISVTLMSNYPFVFHTVYLPISIREP